MPAPTGVEIASHARDSLPRPFLKWVGGKRQLLPELLRAIDQAPSFNGYHEPFLGGGALFFELRRLGKLDGLPVRLADGNPRLIETYLGVRDHIGEVLTLLRAHADRHGKDHYYATRAAFPDTAAERAARILYLNRTCFNGLYRENSKGGFNVPMGRYKNPAICDEELLRAASRALAGTEIEAADFATIAKHAWPGDFVYFDPPYHPVSETAHFTSYAQGGFGEDCQRALADVFNELAQRGVHVLLSNSWCDFIRECYRDHFQRQVLATRAVNSRADRRGAVPEILVSSFPI